MKIKEFADEYYKNRAKCADALGITEQHLNVLVYKDREIEQLKSGKWILISPKNQIYDITVD